MISFKTFLLNESIFNIVENIFTDPGRRMSEIAAMWMFYRTNQARKGVVALHRFYEADDVLIQKLINEIASSHPIDYERAFDEIDNYLKTNKLQVVKNILTNYFSSMQHDADLTATSRSGPHLPRKRITTNILPSKRAFGLPTN